MELDVSRLGAFPEPIFAWAPDTERLERETRSAELKRRRDDLTLAEIECSIDLIDAELAALRRRPRQEIDATSNIDMLTEIRKRLVTLAVRLERLPPQ